MSLPCGGAPRQGPCGETPVGEPLWGGTPGQPPPRLGLAEAGFFCYLNYFICTVSIISTFRIAICGGYLHNSFYYYYYYYVYNYYYYNCKENHRPIWGFRFVQLTDVT